VGWRGERKKNDEGRGETDVGKRTAVIIPVLHGVVGKSRV
jgi:hypothetical protein